MRKDSSRISPTAYYTGQVWVENDLSPASLGTRTGRFLYRALGPLNRAYERRDKRPALDTMLLARHAAIDHLLAQAISERGVLQVVEIAAGMAGRGLRIRTQFSAVRYVEADLPHMVANKQRALGEASDPKHHLVPLDVLQETGPMSLAALAGSLLEDVPTAIITEGLTSYFPTEACLGMWRRFAAVLAQTGGVYITDFHYHGDIGGLRATRWFSRLIGVFSRGEVYSHFDDEAAARQAAQGAGFADATVGAPEVIAPAALIPGADLGHSVRILLASV